MNAFGTIPLAAFGDINDANSAAFAEDYGNPADTANTSAWNAVANVAGQLVSNLWLNLGQPAINSLVAQKIYGDPVSSIVSNGLTLPVYKEGTRYFTLAPDGTKQYLPDTTAKPPAPVSSGGLVKYIVPVAIGAAALIALTAVLKKR